MYIYFINTLFLIYCRYKITDAALLESVLRKWCSENMQQIYRRTHMTKCDFNKVALQNMGTS